LYVFAALYSMCEEEAHFQSVPGLLLEAGVELLVSGEVMIAGHPWREIFHHLIHFP